VGCDGVYFGKVSEEPTAYMHRVSGYSSFLQNAGMYRVFSVQAYQTCWELVTKSPRDRLR
jgi:hypothetical protein